MSLQLEETAKDFSKLLITDMDDKPINKLIEDMFARLEEFQTMVNFAKQERTTAVNMITSILNCQSELSELFQRIDSVESLVSHVKNTLNGLEKDVEKVEEELGCSESKTNKVSNIFTPLFKKNQETTTTDERVEAFRSNDYFPSSETS